MSLISTHWQRAIARHEKRRIELGTSYQIKRNSVVVATEIAVIRMFNAEDASLFQLESGLDALDSTYIALDKLAVDSILAEGDWILIPPIATLNLQGGTFRVKSVQAAKVKSEHILRRVAMAILQPDPFAFKGTG